MNKTCFHYACLLTWKEKHDHCPACYGPLFFEEHGAGEMGDYDGAEEGGEYEAPPLVGAEEDVEAYAPE